MRNPGSIIVVGLLLALASAEPDWAQEGNDAAESEQKLSTQAALAAKVGDDVITLPALEERFAADEERSAEVEGLDAKQVYMAKRSKLEEMIAEVLIAQEAGRRGVAPEALTESLIADIQVPDEEIDLSYRMAKQYQEKGGNSPAIKRRVDRLLAGSEEDARKRIREFNLRDKKRVKLLSFAHTLKEQTAVEVLLKKPSSSD